MNLIIGQRTSILAEVSCRCETVTGMASELGRTVDTPYPRVALRGPKLHFLQTEEVASYEGRLPTAQTFSYSATAFSTDKK